MYIFIYEFKPLLFMTVYDLAWSGRRVPLGTWFHLCPYSLLENYLHLLYYHLKKNNKN